MAAKPDKPLIWLGKHLSLALTLPASVAAGYILGSLFGHDAVGIILGMAAGLIQILRELLREDKQKNEPK
jgi:hypothetical protein